MRRAREASVMAAVAAVVLSACSTPLSAPDGKPAPESAPTPTPCGSTPPRPADGKVWFGASLDGSVDTPQAYAERVGQTPAVLVQFAGLPMTSRERTWVDQAIDNAQQVGTVLLLTLEPTQGLRAVTTPVVDDLVEQVQAAQDRGVPVIVRFAHEMNGSWYAWGQQPEEYVATFRRVADAVHAGAPGAAMLWAPNEGTEYPFAGGRYTVGPGTPEADRLDTDGDGEVAEGDDPYAPYWPGPSYVDWVGMTIYHWGRSFPWGANERPEPGKFAGILRGTYTTGAKVPDFYQEYGVDQGLPVAVTETSALYNPSRPGGADNLAIKRAWWEQVFADSIQRELPEVKMINWFEWDKFEQQTLSRIDWTATKRPKVRAPFVAALPDWLAFGGERMC
ncbi:MULTISPECIES: glycoside hydrolase family 26 protein [unclassified Nocardioides]|uniref:glycoside hydrolase family 26 protein n=1 Tax=unclassified Nocardioides TaxID=2615069 RepID=UPI00361E656E